MKDRLDFFGHDTDARNHPKMKALRATFGFEGYGRFWALNEMIGQSPDCKLDLSKKVNRATTAEDLRMSPKDFEEFLSFLANQDECGLIIYENGIVTTERTQENWTELCNKREADKARKEANRVKRENPTENAPFPTESKENPTDSDTKKSKVKQSKVNKEEFAAFAEKSFPQPEPQEEPFDPESPLPLNPPDILKLTAKNLEEARSFWGPNTQEALDLVALHYEKGAYRYGNPWAGAKTWFVSAGGALNWLKAVKTGKSSRDSPGFVKTIPDANGTVSTLRHLEEITAERVEFDLEDVGLPV